MNSFELNKIIGAVLGTLLFVMGVGFIAEAIYAPRVTSEQSYNLPEPAAATTTAATTAKAAVPLPVLLSQANAKTGQEVAKKCQACHDFTDGGPNKVGPNLYGVVGRPIAEHPGFSYSDALLKHKGNTWTYDNLNKWLTSPKDYAPGTKMTFAGIPDDKDRANLLAYLQTLAKSPVPFPEPAPAGTAGGVKAPDQQAAAKPAPGASTAPAAAPANPNVTPPQPSTATGPSSATTETAPTPSASAPMTEAAPPANTNPAAPAPATGSSANQGTAAPAASAPASGAAPAASAPAATPAPAPATSAPAPTTSAPAPTTAAPAGSAPASGSMMMAPQQIAPAPASAGQ